MKACFVGDLTDPSASGRQRLWALKTFGFPVTEFNQNKYSRRLGREAMIAVRLLHKPRWAFNARQLENDLLETCQSLQPNLIWMEWPRYYTPSLLRKLKSLSSRPFLISFQDDNPFGKRHRDFWSWHSYLKCVPEFDLHLVKRPSDIVNLKSYGAGECRLWMHGVYPILFHPSLEAIEKIYPVSFIGTCMEERAKLIEHLIVDCGLSVHVFGSHWERRSSLPQRYPHLFHPPVVDNDYADVIRRSQICLGLVSHTNEDEWTMRTFEVPGCGTLFLGERTEMHKTLFQDGTEAVFFQGKEECAAKIKEHLAQPERCLAIGEAGYRRCRESGYFLDIRMRELLTFLDDQVLAIR